MTALNAALHRSQLEARSVVIGGDAGSGKSALLAAFRADARATGVITVEGACVEVEARLPFGAFVDVIGSCERAFGSERVERSLNDHGISLRHLKAPGPTEAGERRGDRYQMHGAILGLIGDLAADDRLAVVLEDLHWADSASLELFGYLARRLRSHHVLLVATYRSDELDRRHPLRPALADLRKARLVDEIVLAPLDIGGTEALIRSRLSLTDAAPHDVRELRDLVHERAEGNPFHTEEILETLRQSGRLRFEGGCWTCDVIRIQDAIPTSVADGVVARWAALTPAARHAMLVASVAGHRLDLDLIASVSGTSGAALAPLIHEAIDARLINAETADQPLAFRHALTREALQLQLLQAERTALHGKLAAFLEGRPRHTTRSAELAYHLEGSGDLAKASGYHEAAARDAAASTDYRSAARSMERALATSIEGDAEQGRRQLALVEYLRLSGDEVRANRAASEALGMGQRSGDARLQGQALLQLYDLSYRNNDEIPKHAPLDDALALLEPLGPTVELARAYGMRAGASARLLDGVGAMAFAERARETATVVASPSQLAWATMQVGIAFAVQGRLTEGVAACREAVDIARRAHLVEQLYAALLTLRVQLVASGASSEEQRELQLQMRAVARAHGLSNQAWIIRELQGLHGEADWDGFLRLLPQAPEPERSDMDIPRLMAIFIAVARRGPSAAAEMSAARLADAHGNSAPAATWAAQTFLIAGRAADAVELAAAIRDERVTGRFWGLIPASLVHAVGLFAARECNDPRALSFFIDSMLVERPIPVTANFNRRHVALARAELAADAGHIEDALVAHEVALAECERAQYNDSATPYFMSLIHQRRAELYLRSRPPDIGSAQKELDALLAYWQTAKATWYLGQLRTWASERGLTFPDASGPGAVLAPRQLTSRELEVARLVAQGLTNRAIAARLVLSVRTAESHVDRIRSKLGFDTRAQIASWVTERYGASRSS